MKKIFLCLLLSQFSIGFSQNLLTDLRPGMDGSDPVFDNAKQKGNELFFVASPEGQGSMLYKTNGSSVIVLEGDANSWMSYTLLGFLGNDLIYFSSDWLNETFGIYKTDGTPGSGELILSFNINDITIPYRMNIVKEGAMYFYGFDQNTGYELWRTDGTTAGTYMVKDINPGTESSVLYLYDEDAVQQYFEELNGYIYFGASEPVNGAELWRTDGTEAGTTIVANIEPSQPQIPQMGSNPAFFCVYNNAVYFSAYRTVDGRELWKTDGTEAGTLQVKDIAPGDASPSYMTEYNGSLYFSAYHPDQGYTLYKSNGTNAGTTVVKAPDNGGPEAPSPFVKFKGKLYFSGNYGQYVWYTDGTAAGTNFLPNSSLFNSGVSNLLATTNYIYFMANNGGNDGVYRTTDLPNQISLLTSPSFIANNLYPMFLVNNCLLVRGEDGTAGDEIYTVCSQNTQPVGLDEITVSRPVVFPNPCIDKVMVTCEFDVATIDRTVLYDLSGNTMELSFKGIGQNVISISDLSEFSAGIYFLSIEMNNGQQQQIKLIIE